MKQIKKSGIIALILIILLILLIGTTITYVSNLREKQIEESQENGELPYSFDFRASECLDYDENITLKILEISWIDENKVQIDTKVKLYCEDHMLGGDYNYNNTTKTVNLNYNLLSFEETPDCICIYDLKYIITIEKDEYNFKLIRNNIVDL